MDLGVTRVPKRIESTSPRRNRPAHRQCHKGGEREGKDGDDKGGEERLELLSREVRPDDLDKSDELKETKNTCRRHHREERDFSEDACRVISMDQGSDDQPSAAICSEVLRGRKPTNGTCMLASVPIKYHDEYEI